jgi:hypothetical protein
MISEKPRIKYHSDGYGHSVTWMGYTHRLTGTLDTVRVYWNSILEHCACEASNPKAVSV